MREVIFGFRNQYKIREDGKIFTKAVGNGKKLLDYWVEKHAKFMSCDYTGAGYLAVKLSVISKKSKTYRIHRLVAENFVEGYSEGMYVNHKDSNRENNHFSNLEWVTRSYSSSEVHLRGARKGKDLFNKVLKEESVLAVITLLNAGIRNSRISEHYKIDQSNVSNIKLGKAFQRFHYLVQQASIARLAE